MAKYTVIRTDTADAHIHKIVLYSAEEFGPDVAMEKSFIKPMRVKGLLRSMQSLIRGRII